jgi:hypothetical protein
MGDSRYAKKGFWWENLREREHFEDLRVNGRTILIESLKYGMTGGVD